MDQDPTPVDRRRDQLEAIDQALAVASDLAPFVGPFFAHLAERFSKLQQLRAHVALDAFLDAVVEHQNEVLGRIQSDDRATQLVADLVRAAAEADSSAKIHALAYMAAEGFTDDAKLDEARYVIDVIAQLDVIHVRVLVALANADLRGEEALQTADVLGVSEGLAQSINAKLIQLGVASAPGMTFSGLSVGVRPNELGAEILAMLRSAGDPLDTG